MHSGSCRSFHLRLERSLRQHLQILPRLAFQYLSDLNWFPSNPPSTNPYDTQTERLSTRVYALTFLLTFIILIIYKSAVTITTIVTIESPTIEQLNDLSLRYPRILSCPCSKISSDYAAFITISYSLHPVCNSDFITDQWFDYTIDLNQSTYQLDFRVQGTLYFQAIRSLCELAKDNIESNLAQFLSNTYISTSAISQRLFESHINSTIQQFISSMINTFTWSLQVIRSTTHYNALISASFTNFYPVVTILPGFCKFQTIMFDNCVCAYSPSCFTQAVINPNESLFSDTWDVPGFYRGCFILESVLASRLTCLFNRTCLQELDLHWQSRHTMNVTPLQSSILSQFTPITTMETIMNSLMVDQWKWSVKHETYFRICQPSECTYTIFNRRNLILIVTTLIGLFGGLVTSLKLIIPSVVRFIFGGNSNHEHRHSQVDVFYTRSFSLPL